MIKPHLFDAVRVIAVTKTEPELFKKLNDELRVYIKTNEFMELYKKWHADPSPFWNIKRLSLLFFAIFALTVVMLITWRLISLKRKNNELAKAKYELEKSKNIFLALAEASNDIMIFCTVDMSEILFVSEAYETISGNDIQSFIANPISFRGTIHQDELDKFSPDSILLKESENNSKIRMINRLTGEIHWLICRNYRFCIDNLNKPDYLALVLTDISDVVRAEQEKTAQDSILAQQAKYASMGEMIRAISHQWRQPLNALAICIRMLHEYAEENKVKDEDINYYLSTSKELVEHMDSTIYDFRQFFKADKSAELFDVTATVFKTMQMIEPQMKELSINYDISCSCENNSYSSFNQIHEKTCECVNKVHGFRNEFKHAIINILQNAKDELLKLDIDDKLISIEIKCDENFVIRISDNGGGIPEDMLERIFQTDITSKKKKGRGLGFTFQKKIIESMQGHLWAESTEQGAVFCNHPADPKSRMIIGTQKHG